MNTQNTKTLNVLYLPGIGGDKQHADKAMMKHLRKKLGDKVKFNVYLVNYLKEINVNQEQNFQRMMDAKEGKYMKYFVKIRKLFLNSFGDAISIFAEKKLYNKVMIDIQSGLKYFHTHYPQHDTIVLTHSLGCQLFSCYMHDNRHNGDTSYDEKIKLWVSYGNNIRGFIHSTYFLNIIPFKKPNKDFKWINFFSWSDLLLGYHMTNINPKYDLLLTRDVHVRGFPFLSHSAYSKNKKVIKTIANEILNL